MLLLTYHFPPSAASGSHRLLGFARHLPSYGWRAIVVAPPRLPWEAVDPDLAGELPEETVVYPVPHELDGLLGLPLRYLAYYASWIPRAWPSCARAIRRHQPEVLVTSGPPHAVHVFGLLVKRRFGLPWIADFRDPWVAGGSGGRSRRVRDRFTAAMESAVMATADGIVANAPRAADVIRGHYPAASDKVVTITNGYDPERFRPRRPSPDGPLDIVHPGQIYAGRDPSGFLDALRDVIARRDTTARPVHAVFIGDLDLTYASQRVAESIEARGLGGRVRLVGHLPYEESLDAMMRASILLLLDSPGRTSGVPAKLYEYIGAGRPILALCHPEGDAAWVLRQSGAVYRIAEPDRPEQIREGLAQLIRHVEEEVDAGPVAGSARFTRNALAGELARVLDQHAHVTEHREQARRAREKHGAGTDPGTRTMA